MSKKKHFRKYEYPRNLSREEREKAELKAKGHTKRDKFNPFEFPYKVTAKVDILAVPGYDEHKIKLYAKTESGAKALAEAIKATLLAAKNIPDGEQPLKTAEGDIHIAYINEIRVGEVGIKLKTPFAIVRERIVEHEIDISIRTWVPGKKGKGEWREIENYSADGEYATAPWDEVKFVPDASDSDDDEEMPDDESGEPVNAES